MVPVFAFDVYGTLVDVRSIEPAMQKFVPDAGTFLALWRRKQLEYTFLLTVMGRFEAFARVTARALHYALDATGVRLDPKAQDALLASWLQLRPFPEVPEVLARLHTKAALAVLSNGDHPSLAALLAHTRLAPYFPVVISADDVQRFKPAPALYHEVARRLAQPVGAVVLVSANAFDVIGAKSAGLRSCWVRRDTPLLDPLDIQPDYRVADLRGLLEIR